MMRSLSMAATLGRVVDWDDDGADWAGSLRERSSAAAREQKALRVVGMVNGCSRRKSNTVARVDVSDTMWTVG